jgi:hypothetical protein
MEEGEDDDDDVFTHKIPDIHPIKITTSIHKHHNESEFHFNCTTSTYVEKLNASSNSNETTGVDQNSTDKKSTFLQYFLQNYNNDST